MTSRQHPSRFFLVTGTLAVLGMLVAACDSGTGANTGDGGQNDGPPNCTQPGLFLVSPQAVTLSAQATTELKVRYACDSVPYAGMLVSYEIVGDGKGSTLAAASVQTDADGVAAASLTSGTQSATFEVKASAAGASPLTFSITVNTADVGTIVVHMIYAGTPTYTEYRPYLFQNTQCAAINEFAITGAVQEAQAVGSITATPQFVNVPKATNYTVAVVAKTGANVLGFGCTTPVAVNAGAKTDVDVTISNIPIRYDGVYKLDNKFDMTGLLPPSVGGVIHIFDEMTDDHEIDGNAGNDQWGVDPAAFLLDFVWRQTCHWQCLSGDTYDSCADTQTNHEWGDLKLIYTQDFTSWNLNKPRFFGGCGILDDTAWPLQKWAQNQLQGLLPAGVVNILNIAGDLSRAVDKMHVKSTLTLNDIRPGRQGNFTHVLDTMVVLLHNLAGTETEYQFDMAAMGVGTLTYSGNTTVVNDKLQIPSHEFTLKFGKLVQYIYLHGVLPLLGYSSTGEMFQAWINCATVGTWIHDQLEDSLFGVSPEPATLEGYCDAGLLAAGNFIDNSIPNWIDADTTFTLEGYAEAKTVDAQRVATELNGVFPDFPPPPPAAADPGWRGHWTEGSANSDTFYGNFTGLRQ